MSDAELKKQIAEYLKPYADNNREAELVTRIDRILTGYKGTEPENEVKFKTTEAVHKWLLEIQHNSLKNYRHRFEEAIKFNSLRT